MYIKKEYRIGSWAYWVENYYPGNYGAPGKRRSQRQKTTPEEMEKQNLTNRKNQLQRIIMANFHPGDYFATLTYKKENRPGSIQEAKRILQKFMSKMRRAYKKIGRAFRWVAVTEMGSKGAVHHHIVIEDIVQDGIQTKDLVTRHWKYGQINLKPLYEDQNYERLSDYIAKKETKEKDKSGGCYYTHSRNLVIPKPKRTVMKRRRWPQDPKPRKGFEIDTNSVINGVNPYTGLWYQKYIEKRKGINHESRNDRRDEARMDRGNRSATGMV